MYRIIKYLIAAVWFINGLFCKVLNLVPRHQQIVATILSENYSFVITVLIGILEILMAAWIISGIKTKINVFCQITIIVAMNTLEFILVPDLLLWGKWNAVFAILLVAVILLNEFYLKPTTNKTEE